MTSVRHKQVSRSCSTGGTLSNENMLSNTSSTTGADLENLTTTPLVTNSDNPTSAALLAASAQTETIDKHVSKD